MVDVNSVEAAECVDESVSKTELEIDNRLLSPSRTMYILPIVIIDNFTNIHIHF